MKKFAKIFLLALLVIASVIAVACVDDPGFVNPNGPGNGPGDNGNKYTISVLSKGGLNLDGVKVTAKKNGTTVKSGVSVNGKVELYMDADEYDLVFENLPEGYFIDNTVTHVTSSTSNNYTATFESKVIATTAPSGLVYSVGDVMHDFAFSECEGESYTLASLVEENKAVMLNFWYASCQPCRMEFPAIEQAYQVYSNDLKIVALSSVDSTQQIVNVKQSDGLTFYMGRDTNAAIGNHFAVAAYPTTVIVDRYGVVAHIETGNITDANSWKNIFAEYTSDDYVQTPGTTDGETTPDVETTERVLPNVTMPDSSVIADAIGYQGTYTPETEDEYSWPWTNKEENGVKYVTATNASIDNSYAILYTDIALKPNDVIKYEYRVNTENENDNLYVLINREIAATHTGNSNGWQTCQLYVSAKSEVVELAIVYMKDLAVSADNDEASIKNLTVEQMTSDGSALDMVREAATEMKADRTAYENYVDVILAEDGYYHVKGENGSVGAMLFTDLRGITPWSRLRFDSNVHVDDKNNTEYYYSLYDLSFWYLKETPSDKNFIYNGVNHNELMYDCYEMQGWSANFMIPVDEATKQMIVDFTIEYNAKKGGPLDTSKTWLEFCYYYEHYGQAHDICFESYNPVAGMVFSNAFVLTDDDINFTSATNNKVTANINIPLQIDRGVKYKYTASVAGAYALRTLATDCDPFVFVTLCDENGTPDTKNMIAQDDANDYDRFSNPAYGGNSQVYFYLEEGQTVYFAIALVMPGDVGKYDFRVDYLGETAQKLMQCTTGDGLWSYDEVTGVTYYLAVPVQYSSLDDCFYHVKDDNTLGSKIYINFAHPNFFDANGNSLYEMITHDQNGKYNKNGYYFNFESGIATTGANFTQKMLDYWYAATDGVDPESEMYGMVPANAELVEILDYVILQILDEPASAQAWRQFACYYVELGPNA